MIFRNKSEFTNYYSLVDPDGFIVTETVKENYIVKYFKKIVLQFCNKKHLSSCQIKVNEPKTVSVSSS